MQIDYVLILSAGLGTRMGEIGKKIPKPLWPIINKTLLELQVDFCRSLGFENIYINTHYLHEKIITHVKNKKLNVKVLHEEILLGSGGAIHNLARQKEVDYKGNVLLLNADVFFMLTRSEIDRELKNLEKSRAVLFAMGADASEKYNELVLSGDQLVSIEKPDGKNQYITYSGIGLIKLDGLERCEGYSNFFESVCNFKKETILVSNAKSIEQWDFGTAGHYHKNASRIIENKNSLLKEFLEKSNVNFAEAEKFYSKELNSINLELEENFKANCIVGEGIIQKIV